MWKLHTQACEMVAGTKRKLCKKFQVDTCKTKRDRSLTCAVAYLVIEIQAMTYDVARVRRLCTKFQVNTSKIKIFILGVIFRGRVIGLRSISNLD